jgi:hypothetical protein
MTFIAVLLVLTLIGLLVTIGYIIAVALSFRKVPSRIAGMAAPTKDHAVELINTGKGIAEVAELRYKGYAKHGTRIFNSVKTTASDVGDAAKSVNISDAAYTIKKAAETVTAAQEGLAAAKAVLDMLGKNTKGNAS